MLATFKKPLNEFLKGRLSHSLMAICVVFLIDVAVFVACNEQATCCIAQKAHFSKFSSRMPLGASGIEMLLHISNAERAFFQLEK